MQTLIKIGLLGFIFVTFIGCGSDNKGGDSSSSSIRTIHMQIGEKYLTQKGSTVQKKEDDTIVVMKTNLENNKTYIILQKGAADLTYN